MTNIVVTNQSTEVSDAEVQTMTRAVAAQVKLHAAPLWTLEPAPVTYLPKQSLQAAPPGSWVIAVLDDADQADDLGWHTEQQGDVVYGRVFARPVLQNGGDALSKQLSVASVLSHEVLEVFVDPHVNLWADAGNGTAYSYEVCDPVESGSYPIRIDSIDVTVSNFVTPHWFDPQASGTEQLDKCTSPPSHAPTSTRPGLLTAAVAASGAPPFCARRLLTAQGTPADPTPLGLALSLIIGLLVFCAASFALDDPDTVTRIGHSPPGTGTGQPLPPRRRRHARGRGRSVRVAARRQALGLPAPAQRPRWRRRCRRSRYSGRCCPTSRRGWSRGLPPGGCRAGARRS